MEKTNLLTLVVTLTVGIILAGSLFMPVLADTTTTEKTFTNDGLWRMKAIENGDTWEKTSGGTWTYNDNDILTYASADGGWNACLGDTWLVRCNGTTRGTFVAGTSTSAEVIAATDVITISGSGITSTDTPAITGYGYAKNGEYALTAPTVAPYVKGDSAIYATGWTEIEGTGGVVCHFTGSIDDGLTVVGYSRQGGTQFDSITISDVNIDKTAVNGYNDLFVINKITFTITAPYTTGGDTTTYTKDATYTSYVVPYEVTAELSQHLNAGEITLLNALPILVIIGLVMVGVGAIFIRNRD